jgi:pectate lyase
MDHLAVLDGQDGNMDCNDTANYITVSWCKFNYTDKTKPHKFSNLIGSADSLAVCESRLNITYHHCWWGNWVSERQPRTRYGKIHVADNFFNSDSSSYCTNAGYHASVMAEYNVYLNQKNPIAPDANCYGCASRGNVFTNCSGTTAGLGTAFNPASYYDTSFLDPTNGLQASLTSTSSGAGPTLTWGATTALYPCKVPAMSMTVPVSIQRTIAGNIRIINRCANPLSARIMDLTGKTIQTIRMITPGQVADIFLSSPHVKAGLLVLSVSGNKRLLVVPILE